MIFEITHIARTVAPSPSTYAHHIVGKTHFSFAQGSGICHLREMEREREGDAQRRCVCSIDGFMGRTLRYSNVSLSSPQIDGFKVRTAHSKIHQSDRIIKANSDLFSLVPRP